MSLFQHSAPVQCHPCQLIRQPNNKHDSNGDDLSNRNIKPNISVANISVTVYYDRVNGVGRSSLNDESRCFDSHVDQSVLGTSSLGSSDDDFIGSPFMTSFRISPPPHQEGAPLLTIHAAAAATNNAEYQPGKKAGPKPGPKPGPNEDRPAKLHVGPLRVKAVLQKASRARTHTGSVNGSPRGRAGAHNLLYRKSTCSTPSEHNTAAL